MKFQQLRYIVEVANQNMNITESKRICQMLLRGWVG